MCKADSLREVMTDRAALYRFFAGLILKECSTEYIERMKECGFPAGSGGDEEKGFADVEAYLAVAGSNARQELACDFAKVFLGAGVYDGESAPPYESVYTSDEHLLMQEARDEVCRLYREEGVEPIADQDEGYLPEDHLAFELEFVAYCCDRTIAAADAQDDEEVGRLIQLQGTFVSEHLKNWVPAFCADVRRLARTRFYQGVASSLAAFIEEDGNLLAEG